MKYTCQKCGIEFTHNRKKKFCNKCYIEYRKPNGNKYKLYDTYAVMHINSKVKGLQEFIIDIDDLEKVKPYTWCLTWGKRGDIYGMTKINGKSVKLHRYIMNPPANLDINHKNRNTKDNRKENMEICTRAQNNQNIGIRKNHTVGHKHITKPNKKGVYIFQFRRGGIKYAYQGSKDLNKLLKIRDNFFKNNPQFKLIE